MLIAKDGREIPIADSGAPIRGQNEVISGVVLVFRDQSKERASEKALLESEMQLKQSQLVARVGYYIFNIQSGEWISSEMLDSLFGIDADYKRDITGWLNLIHPEFRDEMADYVTNYVVRDKNEFNKEYKILNKKEGVEYWVHGLGNLEFDENGSPVKMFGTIQDITKRKKNDEILLYQQNLLQQMGTVAKIGGWEFNPVDGKGTWTDEVALIHDLEPGDPTNIRLGLSFYKGSSRLKIENAIKEATENGKPYDLELEMVTAKGNYKWVHSIGLAKIENGKVVNIRGSIQDITERKYAELNLQKSEERWESLFENSPSAVAIYEAVEDGNDFMFTGFNRAASVTDNIRREEVLGQKISTVFPAIKDLGFLETFRRVWKTGETEKMDIKFYKDNRIEGWRDNIIFKLKTGEIVAIYSDITDRMKAETALRESEEKFRNIVTAANEGIMITNPEHLVTFTNNALEKMLGYSVSEIIGRNLREFIDDSELNDYKNKMSERSKGRHDLFERIYKRKDGTSLIGLVSAVPIYDDKNSFTGSLAMITDISEMKKAEEKVQLLAHAVENTEEGISITDLNNQFIFVNEAFTKIFGYRKSELLGQSFRMLIAQNFDNPEVEVVKNESSQSGWNGIFMCKRKDETDFPIFLSLAPVTDENNVTYAMVGIIRDISESVKKEEELNQYRQNLESLVKQRTEELNYTNAQLTEQLRKGKEIEIILKKSLDNEKELNELKTRFISTASHEFRTPLTSVLSSAELIQRYGKKWSNEKFGEHVDRIKNSVDYITRLLDEVLTISRVDSGKIKFSPEKLDLYDFSSEIIEEVRPLSKGRHNFVFNYDSGEKYYSLDSKLVRFILVNLLSNAVKYSPAGGKIEMSISEVKDLLVFKIKDEGIGIPDEDKAHLFEPFHRCINAGDIPGTGLGLSIVRQSVELHDGDISVDSKLGKGSTFIIKLKIQK